jgi:hypothetical protein
MSFAICEGCVVQFADAHSLINHIEMEHIDHTFLIFVCNECQTRQIHWPDSFNENDSDLHQHLNLHTNNSNELSTIKISYNPTTRVLFFPSD